MISLRVGKPEFVRLHSLVRVLQRERPALWMMKVLKLKC